MTRYILLKAGAALASALAAIAGILYQPDEGERPDTWSIRRQDARIFFPLLYLLWIAAAAVLAWAQFDPDPPALLQRLTLPPHQGDGAAYTVLQRFAAIAIGVDGGFGVPVAVHYHRDGEFYLVGVVIRIRNQDRARTGSQSGCRH